jgi:glyoxylase-like metal-dependent hydrolase (beta-lactamase superfamily II)
VPELDPVEPNVSDLVVVGMPLGRWQTNCYVVGDRAAGKCVVIDPGETATERIPDLVRRLGLTCEGILLTHGHLDHHWSAPSLAATFDCGVHLHPDDRWIWDAPQRAFGDLPAAALEQQFGIVWETDDDRLVDLADGETLVRGGVSFQVAHTPGHTPGHVTFLGTGLMDATVEVVLGDPAAADEVLFSGDLVFAGSIGRSDFPRGDGDQLLRSVARSFLTLDDDVAVLSGHGPDTTVGHERRTNPYVQQAARG